VGNRPGSAIKDSHSLGQTHCLQDTLCLVSEEWPRVRNGPNISREDAKLVSKVFKLYTRQRLGQHINNLFIRAIILELYGSFLHHITDVMISDLYVF
jgi:hypothetical protein